MNESLKCILLELQQFLENHDAKICAYYDDDFGDNTIGIHINNEFICATTDILSKDSIEEYLKQNTPDKGE